MNIPVFENKQRNHLRASDVKKRVRLENELLRIHRIAVTIEAIFGLEKKTLIAKQKLILEME